MIDLLFYALPGDASIVEHVHEEVVEIAVDDVGGGDILGRGLVAAAVVDVKLLDFEGVL